ncbi:MAG: hypothetical protein ACN4GR_02735 [Arenicellales bacterium]
MNNTKTKLSTNTENNHDDLEPVIVNLGSVEKLTGKQPRGDKADGGAAGGDYKYASESPRE